MPAVQRGLGRFLPPGDDHSQERSRELLRVAIGAFIAFCTYGICYLVGYGSELGFLLLMTPGLLALCVPFVLRATGSPVFAGHVLASICFVGIGLAAVLRGGFPLSTLMWNALIPMCALLMMNQRWGVVLWTVLCLVQVGVFFALHHLGFMPGFVALTDGGGETIQMLSLFGLLLFLMYAVRSPVLFQRRLSEQRDELQSKLEQTQRLESLGHLAGGIAYDFGNALVGISGAAELLRVRTSSDDPRMRDIAVIQQSSDRAAALTKQLLTFARQQRSRPTILNINNSVAEVQSLLFRIMGNGVTLDTELSSEIGPVMLDPRELDRVLLNLAINGRDAMDGTGRLTLRTSSVEIDREQAREFVALPRGRYVRITVEDTGCGMSQAVADRIFEPFFTTKEAGGGTGLGLSTCYGIVAQAGGEIVVESEQDVGTAFHIYLPVSGQGEAPRPVAPTEPLARSVRIMVVDDEQLVRSTVQNVLAEHGFHVITAASGDEAIALYERARGQIDLVLTDIVMPSMSGPELRHRLDSGDTKPPPIVYMSGRSDGVENRDGRILAKPFTTDQLLEQIKVALGYSSSEPTN